MINVKIAKSKRCYDSNCAFSIYMTFDYDQRIVDTVRNLPQRFYNGEKKEWEAPLPALETVVNSLPQFDFDITGTYVNFGKESETSAKVPDDFHFKTTPFQHQIDGFKFGLKNNSWLLGDEQGLGKTKQAIDIAVAKKLQKCYKHCLIVCGVNGLKWNWVNEIETHSNEKSWILGQRNKAKKVYIGSSNDKLNDLLNLNKIDAYFLITNVETLRNESIVKELQNLCKRGEIGMIVIDEIHKCKNPASQQGKGILKLQPECRIAMTGTPLMNNPFDLFIILKWLGYEGHSFSAFKRHYAVYGGYGGYEVVSYRYLDELQKQLDKIMLRRLKNDVLDLPEKTHINEYVEMTPKQAQIYREVTAEIKMNIDQIKMQNNPLAELIRLRQATGYTGILSSTVKESAKLDRMEELVEEAVENGKKVVIFSNWTQMTSAICDRLRTKYGIGLITGETPDSNRQTVVQMFQEGKLDVMIGTIGAMGTGLTLTAGTVIIFVDHPWTRAAYDQAVDRCHRIGQKNALTIYNLMCHDTIDERIWEIVNRKGALSDVIIDGQTVESKKELIDYLLA